LIISTNVAFSFTPWLQPGEKETLLIAKDRFNGFDRGPQLETVKTVTGFLLRSLTGLKPGVNEITRSASLSEADLFQNALASRV